MVFVESGVDLWPITPPVFVARVKTDYFHKENEVQPSTFGAVWSVRSGTLFVSRDGWWSGMFVCSFVCLFFVCLIWVQVGVSRILVLFFSMKCRVGLLLWCYHLVCFFLAMVIVERESFCVFVVRLLVSLVCLQNASDFCTVFCSRFLFFNYSVDFVL